MKASTLRTADAGTDKKSNGLLACKHRNPLIETNVY